MLDAASRASFTSVWIGFGQGDLGGYDAIEISSRPGGVVSVLMAKEGESVFRGLELAPPGRRAGQIQREPTP